MEDEILITDDELSEHIMNSLLSTDNFVACSMPYCIMTYRYGIEPYKIEDYEIEEKGFDSKTHAHPFGAFQKRNDNRNKRK